MGHGKETENSHEKIVISLGCNCPSVNTRGVMQYSKVGITQGAIFLWGNSPGGNCSGKIVLEPKMTDICIEYNINRKTGSFQSYFQNIGVQLFRGKPL